MEFATIAADMAAWLPDPKFEQTIQRIITRAREEALGHFEETRTRGGLGVGGVTFLQQEQATAEAIKVFGTEMLADLLQLFRDVFGTIPVDVLEWTRIHVPANSRALASGLASRIDGDRQRAGVSPGAQQVLDPVVWFVEREVEIEIGRLELRARFAGAPSVDATRTAGPTATTQSGSFSYDAFISHASEDKPEVAEPLAKALISRGFRPWLDKFELKIGDRLVAKIDEGLAKSRFGVVIVSHAFFSKRWPQAELNGLAAIEQTEGRNKILPVWHRIAAEEVTAHSPLLAAVYAANTSDGIDAIAEQIAAVLRA